MTFLFHNFLFLHALLQSKNNATLRLAASHCWTRWNHSLRDWRQATAGHAEATVWETGGKPLLDTLKPQSERLAASHCWTRWSHSLRDWRQATAGHAEATAWETGGKPLLDTLKPQSERLAASHCWTRWSHSLRDWRQATAGHAEATSWETGGKPLLDTLKPQSERLAASHCWTRWSHSLRDWRQATAGHAEATVWETGGKPLLDTLKPQHERLAASHCWTRWSHSLRDWRLDTLKPQSEKLKAESKSNCAAMTTTGAIAICTTLRRRIHQMWSDSREMVFVDFSGNMDRQNCRVFVVLTHSPSGPRKMACGNRKRLSAGRQCKALFSGQHAYCKCPREQSAMHLPPTKRQRVAAPHHFGHCVIQNISLDKTH